MRNWGNRSVGNDNEHIASVMVRKFFGHTDRSDGDGKLKKCTKLKVEGCESGGKIEKNRETICEG